MSIDSAIYALFGYALEKGLVQPEDKVYIINSLMAVAGLDDISEETAHGSETLSEILDAFCRNAIEKGIISEDTVTRRDLYDTRVMGVVTPQPSEVIRRFRSLSIEQATDMLYRLQTDCNYIRADRIAKNLSWKTATRYGDLEITINLSKPEKDPRDIAAAGASVSSEYPKCALCSENEGFSGTLSKAARQNLRIIPLSLGGEEWGLQYSPYVYYNEHCIVLSRTHRPMKVNKASFERLAEFVTLFPHYFVGSNADKPIVGGSILSHDHYQGGRHVFPMEKAAESTKLSLDPSGIVYSALLSWPMSVIRLRSDDRERLIALADCILQSWSAYSDPSLGIIAEDRNGLHNAITPIFRRREESYECDLVLRNNRTSPEYPLGIFHPHADKHHIKKENIGLIEVMGLAILPPRLKGELEELKRVMLSDADPAKNPRTASHAAWAADIISRRSDFCAETADDILREEVGKVFAAVLEDAGVFKHDDAGRDGFARFAAQIDFI